MMTLPATLEGAFSISVEKEDVDDNGVSELNFGADSSSSPAAVQRER